MTIFEELKELLDNFLHWLYLFLFLSVFFFTFGLRDIALFEKIYTLPYPSQESFAVKIFNLIEKDLLPKDVFLVVTNPMSAFIAQILISLFFALLISFPFLIHRVIKYLAPALLPHEKDLITKSVIPSVVLFLGGCIFAYYFLIPATFKILFPYATSIGALPFFSVNEFISTVLGLMLATGIMFLLPIFMIMLSFIGLVKSHVWKSKWRYALMFFLIFSAIVTPDGTGVTMILLCIPLISLYFIGCTLTARFDRSKMTV